MSSRSIRLCILACLLPACAQTGALYERLSGAYHLRGDASSAYFREGETWTVTESFQVEDAALTLTGPGGTFKGTMSLQRLSATLLQGVSKTEARLTIQTDTSTRESTMLGEKEKEQIEEPLHGATVRLRVGADGRYTADLEAGTPTQEQQRALEEIADGWRGIEEEYPLEPVGVGDSWSVPPAALTQIFADGQTLGVDGEMLLTFEEVVDFDGERCARLRANLNAVEVESRDLDTKEPVTMTIGGTATIYRSLDRDITLYEEYRGPWSMVTTMVPDPASPNEKVNMRIDGDMVLTTKR